MRRAQWTILIVVVVLSALSTGRARAQDAGQQPSTTCTLTGQTVTVECTGADAGYQKQALNWDKFDRWKNGAQSAELESCNRGNLVWDKAVGDLTAPPLPIQTLRWDRNHYDWLKVSLGNQPKCGFYDDGEALKQVENGRCAVSLEEDSLSFTLTNIDKSVVSRSGKIWLKLEASKGVLANGIWIPVVACAFELESGVPLVSGAQEQVLSFSAPRPCIPFLEDSNILTLKRGSISLRGTKTKESKESKYRFSGLPNSIASSTDPWTVVTNDHMVVGSILLLSVPPLQASDTLEVSYPPPADTFQSRSEHGKAIVDAMDEHVPDSGPHVWNTVSIDLPVELAKRGIGHWQMESSDVHIDRRIAVDGTKIRFRVNQAGSIPLHVTLSSCESTECTSQNSDLRVEIPVATSAQRESVPLPIADALFVACQAEDYDNHFASDDAFDIAGNGTNRAIETTAVSVGSCFLVFDPSKLPKDVLEILPIYGPQMVEVATTPVGNPNKRSWRVDMDAFFTKLNPKAPLSEKRRRGWVKELPLSLPAEGGANGDYTVDASIQGYSAGSVIYRSATPSAAANGIEDVDRHFRASLHPRGNFGWRAIPARTFVTVTLAQGIRAPAVMRSLERSSQSTQYQSTGPRLGTLLVLEPWDYNASKSKWPFGTRFVAGMLFEDATHLDVGASFVAGVGASLPLLDTRTSPVQFQSAASVNFLYEAERLRFEHGSHFLVTVGIEIGSIFGAK